MPSGRPAGEVAAVHAAYYAAFETGDLDAMGVVWADGEHAAEVWVVHPGLAPIRGRDKVLRSYAAAMAAAAYLQFVLTDVHVQVSDQLAVVTCVENVLAAAGDDSALSGGTSVATTVLRHGGGGWRVLGHHASAAAPPR